MYGGRGGVQAAAGNAVSGGGHGALVDLWSLGATNDQVAPGSFSTLPGFTTSASVFSRVNVSGSGATSGNAVQTSVSRSVFGGGGGAGHSTTGPASGVATTGTLGGGNGGNGNGAGAGANGASPNGGDGSGTTQGGSGGNGKIRVTVL
jgi:hypothetical protein